MPEIAVFADPDALAAEAADRIIQIARASIEERGRFLIALAGGSTPEKTYLLLTQTRYLEKLDWSKVWIFFGDERCVPLDDSRSNYAMARRTLLEVVPVPPSRIFAIPTENIAPEQAASDYSQTLSRICNNGYPPRLDLILLGMGDDGHTASLFPHAPTLDIKDRWAASSPPGILPPPVERITITYPILNAARNVMFLVSGAKKAAPIHEILDNGIEFHEHPAAGVHPTDGTLLWLLDEAAASLLQHKVN